MPTITLGIPTYNRKAIVADGLRRMLEQGIHRIPGVDILVIDDGSTDGTHEALAEFAEIPNVTVRKNPENLGFSRNFGNLLLAAQGEYLLVNSDDEITLKDGLLHLLRHLATHSTGFLCPAYFEGGKRIRGQAMPKAITLREWRNATTHLPGLVFKTDIARAIWREMSAYIIDPRNWYPQSCVAYLVLLMEYPAEFFPAEVCQSAAMAKSGLGKYWTVAGRWDEFRFFDEFFCAVHARLSANGDRRANLAGDMVEQHRKKLFANYIGAGINAECNKYLQYYLEGAAEFLQSSGR